jgi:hypothetical protein
MHPVETCSALAFGELSRLVAAECRRHGLVAPSFRSPPRREGATRTLRRYRNGQWLVSVRCRGRPVDEVVSDMVDGALVANGLHGTAAEGWRITLRAACGQGGSRAA